MAKARGGVQAFIGDAKNGAQVGDFNIGVESNRGLISANVSAVAVGNALAILGVEMYFSTGQTTATMDVTVTSARPVLQCSGFTWSCANTDDSGPSRYYFVSCDAPYVAGNVVTASSGNLAFSSKRTRISGPAMLCVVEQQGQS